MTLAYRKMTALFLLIMLVAAFTLTFSGLALAQTGSDSGTEAPSTPAPSTDTSAPAADTPAANAGDTAGGTTSAGATGGTSGTGEKTGAELVLLGLAGAALLGSGYYLSRKSGT